MASAAAAFATTAKARSLGVFGGGGSVQHALTEAAYAWRWGGGRCSGGLGAGSVCESGVWRHAGAGSAKTPFGWEQMAG